MISTKGTRCFGTMVLQIVLQIQLNRDCIQRAGKSEQGRLAATKGQGTPMLTVPETTELIIHMTQLSPASQTSLPFSFLLAALAGQKLPVTSQPITTQAPRNKVCSPASAHKPAGTEAAVE